MNKNLFRKIGILLAGVLAVPTILLLASGCTMCHIAHSTPELDYYGTTQGSLRIYWNFDPEPVLENKPFKIRIVLHDSTGESLPAADSGKIYLRPGPDQPVWIASWDAKAKMYSTTGVLPEAGRQELQMEYYSQQIERITVAIPMIVRAKESGDHESHGSGGFLDGGGGGGSCH